MVYCVLPFIHFQTDSNGTIRPCCLFSEAATEGGRLLNASIDGLSSYLNGEWLASIRKDMLEGKTTKGCFKCHTEDTMGKFSRRQKENQRFASEIEHIKNGQYHIKIVDLKLGNTCNLKCTICSENSSSKWVSEKLNWEGGKLTINDEFRRNMKWYENEQFWDEFAEFYRDIEYIEIFGGEPFLIKQQFDFLNLLIELGVSKNITLSYATNGTILPEHAVSDIFPKFKDVILMVSGDGIGDVFEYNRFPAKWMEFDQNVKDFRNHIKSVTIAYSLSMFSIYNLMESLEYYASINQPVWINIVYGKTSVSVLPREEKEYLRSYISERFDQQVADITGVDARIFLSMLDDEENMYDFEQSMLQIAYSDVYRNSDISKAIPRLGKYRPSINRINKEIGHDQEDRC